MISDSTRPALNCRLQPKPPIDLALPLPTKPTCAADPESILRLIGQVVTVSLETVRLVRDLAALSIDQA